MKNKLSSVIEVSDKLRPCFIFDTNSCGERVTKKALFHMWIRTENMCSVERKDVKALVEYEDGAVELRPISQIQFLDSQFKEYFWGRVENE